VELTRANIPFERQKVYPLYYRGELIGGYIADIVVDNAVICSFVVFYLPDKRKQQNCLGYSKSSLFKIGTF
jgi:GxxExxY protein